MRLNEHYYPQFSAYIREGLATGTFAISSGFKNLFGAIWLHMAWLLEAEGERVRRSTGFFSRSRTKRISSRSARLPSGPRSCQRWASPTRR